MPYHVMYGIQSIDIHVMYTLLYTYAIPAHSLVLTGSQALVPTGPAKLCLVRCLLLLVHIQVHLYSHLVLL